LSKILEKITSKTFEQSSTELFIQNGLKTLFIQTTKHIKPVKGYEENENGILEYVDNV
jgi:hypothetical protein